MSKEISSIEGKLVAETEEAVLIKFKLEKQSWIPKSFVANVGER